MAQSYRQNENGDTEKKREIISSMYPIKLTFDGEALRTPSINEVARLIYIMDVGFSENKNRTTQNNSGLSCQVGMTRFELPRKAWHTAKKFAQYQ